MDEQTIKKKSNENHVNYQNMKITFIVVTTIILVSTFIAVYGGDTTYFKFHFFEPVNDNLEV